MSDTAPKDALLPLISVGLAAGLLAGLLGVGGGIVMIPMMVGLLRYDQHTAHATSLAAIVVIAATGSVGFATEGAIDLAVGVTMGIGGIAGATAGAHVMNRLSTGRLKLVFSVVVLLAGLRMLIAGGASSSGADEAGLALTLAIGAGIGLLAGVAAGIAGVGGGIIMVPAMVFFLGLSQHTAEGTSLIAIMLTAIAGTRVNLGNQRVRLRSALIMGGAGALASPFAARFAVSLDAETLSRVFGLFVVAAGTQMLVSAYRNRR